MERTLRMVGGSQHRSLHIATLSDQTIAENDAEHLGCDGYFLFEASDEPGCKGITILAKVCSLDAAFRLLDAWGMPDLEVSLEEH